MTATLQPALPGAAAHADGWQAARGLCSNPLEEVFASLPPWRESTEYFSVPSTLKLLVAAFTSNGSHTRCLLFSHDPVDTEFACVGLCLKLMGPA